MLTLEKRNLGLRLFTEADYWQVLFWACMRQVIILCATLVARGVLSRPTLDNGVTAILLCSFDTLIAVCYIGPI